MRQRNRASVKAKDDAKQEHMIEKKIHKRVNKNAPKGMDLNLMSYQYFKGTDLLSIEGVSYSTVLTLISEVGDGLYKFKSAKEFASWLRLAPNNKISGGKLLSSKTPNGSNRLKIALRNAANVIGNLKDTTLSNFFARKAYQKGRHVAISATARKLAVIIWNMVVKGESYKPEKPHEYLDQKRKKITAMKRQMAKMGITIEELETPIQSAS